MPKLKGLLDSANAKLAGLLGDFPQGFNAGAVAGFPGWAGDMAYLADTARLALTGADSQAAPEDYVGTTDYIAKQAGYPVPQTLSGQLGAAVGGLMSPGPGDLAKFAPVLGAIIPGSAWDSPKLPTVDALARNVNKLLYHSGTADDVAGMKYGIEPTNEGPWIREILNGSVDDPEDIIETATPLAWMSDKPEWVKIKVARKLGKPLSEVTEADIAEHGHLAIINKKTAESAYRVGPEGLNDGPYSVVTNNKGEQLKAYETPLYGETRDFRKTEPFGVERNEWVSTDTVEPLVHLTGDELVQYLSKVEGRSEPLKAAEDFAARRAGKAKPYKEAMRVLYRGSNDSGESIKGGIAEGALFAAANEKVAQSYAGTGGNVERIGVKPDAKILVEGSPEYATLTGRRRGKLINTMRKGENIKTAADDVARLAREAGYDAVEFTSMEDMGIAIFNPDKFIRGLTE